jgi:hypothetical protein
MSAAAGRIVAGMMMGFVALSMSGCADLPAWVPFQGPRNDTIPGVVAPAEKIAQLKKLASEGPKSDQPTKQRVIGQLTAAIRNEPDALIRAEIVRTLGCYPDPSADAILQTALMDPDADVRIAACEAWGKRGSAQAAALLAPVLTSDVKQDVRLAAARALGKIKDPQAVAALGEALTDPDPAMQYRAVLSLKESTGQDLGNNVEKWREYVSKGQPPPEKPTSIADRMKSVF